MEKKNYLKPNLREVKMKQRKMLCASCGNYGGTGDGCTSTDSTPSRSFNLDEEDY